VDSIRELDEERWDALAHGELQMSHRWQRVMEASLANYRPRYLLAGDDRGPLLSVVADTSQTFGRSGWRELLLRRLTLMLGAPFSSRHSGLAMRPDAPAECLERVLPALCLRERRPLLGVANVDVAQLAGWRAHGFSARSQPASMLLDLPSASYEAYLASLRARDRHEIRRARRRAAELDVTFDHAPLATARTDLYPLLAEVGTRHTSLPFTPQLFPSVARELRDEALLFSASIGGQLAAFFLCLQQRQMLLAILAGLRYALAYPASAYFLLLDELVRWSLQHGIRRIHAGLSNEAQKQRHGFTARARWLCFRAYPGPLNHLVRRGS
jgi:predicted N-acyltransferase